MEKNWRNKYRVMVPQADAMGAIAAIRSLGEHGYDVYAVSANPNALGLASRFASHAVVSPDYDEQYVPWLREFIARENIQAIVHSEGFLIAIQEHYEEFCHLIPGAGSREDVYRCMSKTATFGDFLSQDHSPAVKSHIPPTLVIKSDDEIDWQAIGQWPLPLFIKGDAYFARTGDESLVKRVETLEEARALVEQLRPEYEELLIQGCVKGAKATVNILAMDGKILAESMVIASHHNPHTGGLTSLRKSWWQEDMYQDALQRLAFLNWQGAAMVEYSWDDTTQSFNFIELNARYWAALNLDILAGIHFPCYQMDYFFEKLAPEQAIRLTQSICARHALPADFGYALSLIKDKNVGLGKKLYCLVEFFALFLHPGIKADLLYPGDRKLYFINLGRFCKEFIRSALSRLNL